MDAEQLHQEYMAEILRQLEAGETVNPQTSDHLAQKAEGGHAWASLIAVATAGPGAPAWAFRGVRKALLAFTQMDTADLNEAFDVERTAGKLGPQQRRRYNTERLAVVTMCALRGEENPYPGDESLTRFMPVLRRKADALIEATPNYDKRTHFPELTLAILTEFGLHRGLTVETIKAIWKEHRRGLGESPR